MSPVDDRIYELKAIIYKNKYQRTLQKQNSNNNNNIDKSVIENNCL